MDAGQVLALLPLFVSNQVYRQVHSKKSLFEMNELDLKALSEIKYSQQFRTYGFVLQDEFL